MPESASITSQVIHWATGAGEMDESESPSTSNFDVIIAADCLFFKDFHEDLLTILSSRLTDEGILLPLLLFLPNLTDRTTSTTPITTHYFQ